MVLSGKRGSAAQSRFRDHVFYCLPIWGGSNTPTGKGYDYFRQTRADAPEEIAASQLGGLKLIGLAWIWTGVRALMNAVVRGDAAPHMTTFLEDGISGYRLSAVPSRPRARESGLPERSGRLSGSISSRERCESAIVGHLAVGVLRLFGFRVFRNVYRPLLSTTLVEFWNRFNYYFKELLVEFFFFPTFLKAFKSRPRLRIFAATMAAAGAGNLYYHLMRDSPLSVSDAFRRGRIVDRQPRPLLASARRRHLRFHAPGEGTSGKAVSARDLRWSALRRLRAIVGVWLFYSLLHIWGMPPLELGFGQRARFFCSLFGF